jgi:hypothetical protein
MRLDEGWNQIQFNLSDFTRRAYGTNYIETLRLNSIPLNELEFRYMLIAEFEEFTFQIDYIARKNSHQSSSYSCPSKSSSE